MSFPKYLVCAADSANMLPIGGDANIAAANHPISQKMAEIGPMRINAGAPWGLPFMHPKYGGPTWSSRTITRMANRPTNYLEPMPVTLNFPQARISGNNTTVEPLRIPNRYPNTYSLGGTVDGVHAVYEDDNQAIRLFREIVWEHHSSSPIASSHIARSIFHRWHGVAPGDRQGPSASGIFNMFGAINGELVSMGEIPHALHFATNVRHPVNGTNMLSRNAVLPAIGIDGYASLDNNANGPCPYGTLFTYPHGSTMPGGLTALGQIMWRAIYRYGMYPVDGSLNGIAFRGDQHIPSAMLDAWRSSGDINTLKQNLRPVLKAGQNPSGPGSWSLIPDTVLAWEPDLTTKGGGTPRAQNFGHGNGATPPPPSTSEPTVLNAIARRLEASGDPVDAVDPVDVPSDPKYVPLVITGVPVLPGDA